MSVDALVGPDERVPAEPAGPDLSELAGSPAVPGHPSTDTLAQAPAPMGAPIDVRIIDGGIIEVALPANEEIGGIEARVAGAAVREVANGRRMPVMLVIRGVLGVSVEARHVYATSIAPSAFAVVGESPVDRVIAHYLLRSRSETIAAEFFTSEAEAVEWLGHYTSGD